MKEITLAGAAKISSPNPLPLYARKSLTAVLILLPYRGGLICRITLI